MKPEELMRSLRMGCGESLKTCYKPEQGKNVTAKKSHVTVYSLSVHENRTLQQKNIS